MQKKLSKEGTILEKNGINKLEASPAQAVIKIFTFCDIKCKNQFQAYKVCSFSLLPLKA